jgi:uncharacterized phiE125 gp8 family phage protein
MQRILITAPTDEVISLDEMKKHLRYEDDEQDITISALLAAVISTLDPAAEGSLGRALRPQTWELQLDGFPYFSEPHRDQPIHGALAHGQIDLPFPPLISLISVKYDDLDGTEHTLVENTDFIVIGKGGRSKQSIKPPYLGWWPLARCYPGSVRVRFQSGYPAPATGDADTLPGGITAYIKLVVSDLFANREGSDLLVRAAIENPNLSRLLDVHRVY